MAQNKKRRNQPTIWASLSEYARLVLLLSVFVGTLAVVITGSGRIAIGTITLGIFLGYLIYSGLYN